MAVSKQNKEDYEQGLRNSQTGLLETFLSDLIVNHPDSSAYYKRERDGDQLDDDKVTKDKDN